MARPTIMKTRSSGTAALWRAGLAVLLAAVPAFGQFKTHTQSAPANSYAKIEVFTDHDLTWVPMQPLDLAFDEYRITKDGKSGYLILFDTGASGTVYYLDSERNGETQPLHVRFKIVAGDSPQPDPVTPDPVDPDPSLSGLAKKVYDAAKAFGNKTVCRQVGDACGSVASAIAAGGINTAQKAHETLREQMPRVPRAFKPVGDIIVNALNTDGQTLKGAQQTLNACAEGLWSAAK